MLLGAQEESVTGGIGHIYIETHNWGRTVAFWQALGFVLTDQTDHLSGRLNPPGGQGPYLFVAEVGEDRSPETLVYLDVPPGTDVDPPEVVERLGKWETTHWGTRTQTIRDPDGRLFVLEQDGL
jgi:catechol 2,3-dioxygenase-like lactoylglutathione lyase family enzyme